MSAKLRNIFVTTIKRQSCSIQDSNASSIPPRHGDFLICFSMDNGGGGGGMLFYVGVVCVVDAVFVAAVVFVCFFWYFCWW